MNFLLNQYVIEETPSFWKKGRNYNPFDETILQFSYLTVIRQNGRTKYQQVKWLCECICGNQTTVVSNNLGNGNTESCGCKRQLTIRQGYAWEKLVGDYLEFKFENYKFHHRLPNKKLPDFIAADGKIILDAKLHDWEPEKSVDLGARKIVNRGLPLQRLIYKTQLDRAQTSQQRLMAHIMFNHPRKNF